MYKCICLFIYLYVYLYIYILYIYSFIQIQNVMVKRETVIIKYYFAFSKTYLLTRLCQTL